MLLWFESGINISPSEKGHTLLIFKAFLYIFSHFLSPIYVNEILIIYKILIKIPDMVKTHAVVCMGAGGMGAGRGSMGGGGVWEGGGGGAMFTCNGTLVKLIIHSEMFIKMCFNIIIN